MESLDKQSNAVCESTLLSEREALVTELNQTKSRFVHCAARSLSVLLLFCLLILIRHWVATSTYLVMLAVGVALTLLLTRKATLIDLFVLWRKMGKLRRAIDSWEQVGESR